jgi:PleD family two-component response regulator
VPRRNRTGLHSSGFPHVSSRHGLSRPELSALIYIGDSGYSPYTYRRLLIVEDQLENRLLLHSLLEPFGFDLREAFNGQEAVSHFAKWRPA